MQRQAATLQLKLAAAAAAGMEMRRLEGTVGVLSRMG